MIYALLFLLYSINLLLRIKNKIGKILTVIRIIKHPISSWMNNDTHVLPLILSQPIIIYHLLITNLIE